MRCTVNEIENPPFTRSVPTNTRLLLSWKIAKKRISCYNNSAEVIQRLSRPRIWSWGSSGMLTLVIVKQAPIFRANLRPPLSDCKNYCQDGGSMFHRNSGTCPPNNKTPRHIRTQSPSRTSFMPFNLRKYNCRPKNSEGLSLSTLSTHHLKASYLLQAH